MPPPKTSFSAGDIISAWEAGESQHPIDRALTMLQLSAPGESRAALARLSIGGRDRRLLDLREQHYGRVLQAVSRCSKCGESIELEFSTDDVRSLVDAITPVNSEETSPLEMESDGWSLAFRLPDSRDLAAVVDAPDRDAALSLLTRRCLLRGRHEGRDCAIDELPAEAIARWRSRLPEFDPQAETRLALQCPACAHAWTEHFDIAAFLWLELAAEARRLVREIDEIARAYGWSEREILALTPVRRAAYLELIRG